MNVAKMKGGVPKENRIINLNGSGWSKGRS